MSQNVPPEKIGKCPGGKATLLHIAVFLEREDVLVWLQKQLPPLGVMFSKTDCNLLDLSTKSDKGLTAEDLAKRLGGRCETLYLKYFGKSRTWFNPSHVSQTPTLLLSYRRTPTGTGTQANTQARYVQAQY